MQLHDFLNRKRQGCEIDDAVDNGVAEKEEYRVDAMCGRFGLEGGGPECLQWPALEQIYNLNSDCPHDADGSEYYAAPSYSFGRKDPQVEGEEREFCQRGAHAIA